MIAGKRSDDRAELILRHSPLAQVGAAAALVVTIGLLVDELTPQNVVLVLLAAVSMATVVRGRVELRGDALHQRGLRGWKQPFPLPEMTGASLRREMEFRRWALELHVTRNHAPMFSIECWAWGTEWRFLAHVVGHVARELGVDVDDVSARRLACPLRNRCELDEWTPSVLAGRSAVSKIEPDVSTVGVLQSLQVGGLVFVAFFAIALFHFWLQNDINSDAVIAMVIIGAIFGVPAFVVTWWEGHQARAKPDRAQRGDRRLKDLS